MRIWRILALLALAVGLGGCSVSQIETSYLGINPREAAPGLYQLCSSPGLWTGPESAEQAIALAEQQGLQLVGVSRFVDSGFSERKAEEFGNNLGVCLIYLDKSFAYTEHGIRVRYVVVGYETRTRYDQHGRVIGTDVTEIRERVEEPYTIDYYNFAAYFFARPA